MYKERSQISSCVYFPSFLLLLACLHLVSFRLSTTLFLKHDCKHRCTGIHLRRSLSCTNPKKYQNVCMCVFVQPFMVGCRVPRKSDISLRNFKELSLQFRPEGTQRRGTGMYTLGTTLFCKKYIGLSRLNPNFSPVRKSHQNRNDTQNCPFGHLCA